ncbi:AAWKG family protein [Streptomyces sp. NBC_01320]|uniref:AAWKG family protein n=1 Tax=Streptomyces sp. NBC_01320 TaxID=2903824 RepID=UPI002E0FC038|nr:AAWKG family protein [Streptomyces sp. NBC_01320]WSK02102.1 AAWKG family protein [Streptomyces sp. NBC_01320]
MNNDDYWKKAVDMLTGYILPERKTLFDNMKGNDGIPLMHVRMPHGGADFDANFVSGGGWRYDNTDYVIPFFVAPYQANEPGAGSSLDKWWAYITFIGTDPDKSNAPGGQMSFVGSEHTSGALKDKGRDNKDGESVKWDDTALYQYIDGSGEALSQIAYEPYSTHGYSNRGVTVDDSSYVDLLSFTEVGKAFDRAVKFFEDAAKRMEEWDGQEVGEGSDSWSGTGASLFKHLVHKLRKNYEGYVEQLNGGDGGASEVSIDGYALTSKPARALITAQSVIRQEAENLYNTWLAWWDTRNPHRWLYDLLQQLRLELFDTQYDHTDIDSYLGFEGPLGEYFISTAGFRQGLTIEGKEYGLPHELSTWKAIGEEAVRRWDHHAQEWLSAAGAESIVRIAEALRDVSTAFDDSLTDRDHQSLSEIADKEQVENDRKQAEKDREDARKQADEDRAQAEKDRADARQQVDEDREQAKKDREDARKQADEDREQAKKDQDAARAQAEKDRADARQQVGQDRAQQEKDREQAKKDQDAARAQAEKDRADARQQVGQDRSQQEKDREQAKKDQDAARAQAEKDRADARQQVGQDRSQQEKDREQAKKDQDAARAQAEKDRADARQQVGQDRSQQEKDREQAKKDQDAARAQAEKDRAEAKKQATEQQSMALSQTGRQQAKDDAERERLRKQQEQDRQEARAQAEKDRTDARNHEAEARAQSDKDREDARKQQEQARQQAVQQQQAARDQADHDREAARQQATQDRQQAGMQQGQDRERLRTEQDQARQQAAQQQQAARDQANQDREAARQQALKQESQAKLDLQRDKTDARAQYQRDLANARAESGTAEQAANQHAAQAKQDFEHAQADAKDQRDQAHQEADRERAQAKKEYEKALSDGKTSAADAKAQYDRKLDDINHREQDAIHKADQAEAKAKQEYQREKDAAQHERDDARQNAEQARKQAKADYDRRMADIQSESDRLRAPQKDMNDLIRQRIDGLPRPGGLSSTYSPYGSEFGGNLYNQDDLASALGRDDQLAANASAGPGGFPGSPGMFLPPGRGGGMGGEGGSAAERTRAVVEPGVGRAGRRGTTLEEQENSVKTRGSVPTASGMPFAPPMAGGMGPQQNQSTESGDRERTTWLAEDEDVWGTDEGGAPQALGR